MSFCQRCRYTLYLFIRSSVRFFFFCIGILSLRDRVATKRGNSLVSRYHPHHQFSRVEITISGLFGCLVWIDSYVLMIAKSLPMRDILL